MNRGRRSPTPSSPLVDLHCHSVFSDGELSPQQVATEAQRLGLAAVALTDHDCLDGLPAFFSAAVGFEAVAGVEISARREGSDVHVLGYWISPEDEQLRRRLEDLAGERRRRAAAMVDRLRSLGVAVDPESVTAFAGRGTVGRPHLARALVESGAVSSVEEAFRLFLRPGRPGYVEKQGPSPEEAIRWIHDAGGVAVLAHPGLLHHDRWIEDLARAGLDGIEVWHPRHGPQQRRRYAKLARDLDLVGTGGSDYHGESVGDARIGQEPVPAKVLESLRERLRPR